LILIKISLWTGTIDGCRLLQVTYKENMTGNLSTVLDLADHVDAPREVKENLAVRNV
jgi:hypothetical protein